MTAPSLEDQIEALAGAWDREHRRESQLLQDVLSALVTAATARRRMIDDIALGVITASGITPPKAGPKTQETPIVPDLEEAVRSLRSARQHPGAGYGH